MGDKPPPYLFLGVWLGLALVGTAWAEPAPVKQATAKQDKVKQEAAESHASDPGAALEPFAIEDPKWLVPTLHATALVVGCRLSLSLLWPDAFSPTDIDTNAAHFKAAWTQAPELGKGRFFEWDGDPWTINLVGHGLMGSEYYLRYRQAHHGSAGAFVMTVAFAVVWEYFIEAWHKRPSGLDLIWTPIGGALIGEGRYQLYGLIRTIHQPVMRHILFYTIDPLGQLERDLFGLEY